jgi:hypothetical protein
MLLSDLGTLPTYGLQCTRTVDRVVVNLLAQGRGLFGLNSSLQSKISI